MTKPPVRVSSASGQVAKSAKPTTSTTASLIAAQSKVISPPQPAAAAGAAAVNSQPDAMESFAAATEDSANDMFHCHGMG